MTSALSWAVTMLCGAVAPYGMLLGCCWATIGGLLASGDRFGHSRRPGVNCGRVVTTLFVRVFVIAY